MQRPRGGISDKSNSEWSKENHYIFLILFLYSLVQWIATLSSALPQLETAGHLSHRLYASFTTLAALRPEALYFTIMCATPNTGPGTELVLEIESGNITPWMLATKLDIRPEDASFDYVQQT